MFIKLYLIALPVFLAIDMIWLALIAKDLYAKQLGFLMSPTVNWAAGLLFYLLFIAGLVVFVLLPSLHTQSYVQVLLMGALFGLVSYATYDLTNAATIKNWPMMITVIDMVWGAVLSASVSGITLLISRKLGI